MIHKYKILWILPVLITGLLNIYCKIDLGLDTGTVDINLEYYTYLYIMDADGSNQTDISISDPNHDPGYSNPVFSPDGTKILVGMGQNLFIMNIDGSNVIKLADFEYDYNGGHQFSPDGTRIIFIIYGDIYITDTNGGTSSNLTADICGEEPSIWSPRFSPDGSKIHFSRRVNGYAEIYIMNTDGSEQRNLTKTGGRVAETEFALSPDGSKIVYIRGAVKRKS